MSMRCYSIEKNEISGKYIDAFLDVLSLYCNNKDFKIIYTSDSGTTNLNNLVDFCKGADLIICESSFLQKHNANSKTHMTAYDAGILASKSNAQKLLLTHFWPEEDKRLYLEEAKQCQ